MKTTPTRWFELSHHELKALLCAACIVLLCLAGFSLWQRVTYSAEFAVFNAPEALPRSPLIDINSAPAHELRFLDGIGEARAQDIIEYRNEYGPFKSVDELQKISGIGASTVNRIRPDVMCALPEESVED